MKTYNDKVTEALDKIADQLDSANANEKYANFQDSVSSSLTRMADKFNASQLLPSVSSSSNGKVLTVKSGKWSAQPNNALPSVTAADNGKSLVVDNGAWTVGSGGTGVLVVNDNDGTLDKTWKEISDAFDAEMPVRISRNSNGFLYKLAVIFIATDNTDTYKLGAGSNYIYETTTESGYPVYSSK